ncbi:hypothetical protein ACHAXM_006574 [Skeletonema potamos]
MNINNQGTDDGDSHPSADAINTENKSVWTQFLPEKFGIRKSIEDSPYGWCYRESFLWGIATGTAMGIHRLRMKSHPLFAINIAFLTTITVTLPSYYFCYRKREHQERVIEMMMAANDFRPGEEIPDQIPVGKDHPFLDVKEDHGEADKDEATLQKEFVARLKEKKEWQEQHQIQDAHKIFKEKK